MKNLKNSNFKPLKPLILGKLGSVYGVFGWIKTISFVQKKVKIFDYQPWFFFLKLKWFFAFLEQWNKKNGYYIVKIHGINNREEAKLFINKYIFVDSFQLPRLSCGEYYWHELIGSDVFTIEKIYLGKVVDIMETGANDVLVVKLNKSDNFKIKDILIPFIEEKVIKKISIVDHIIFVNWNINY